VFKFFKELIDSVKEGVEEGKAELAAEAREREIANALQDSAQMEAALPGEVFLTALGGPYRWLFVGETKPDLSFFDIAEAKRKEVAKLLERDFGAHDNQSLMSAALVMENLAIGQVGMSLHTDLLESEHFNVTAEDSERRLDEITAVLGPVLEAQTQDDSDGLPLVTLDAIRTQLWQGMDDDNALDYMSEERAALLAVGAARVCYLVSTGAGLGYIDRAAALAHLARLTEAVRVTFPNWSAYADAYVAGEKLNTTNNALGRKFLADATKRLLKEPTSPWVFSRWPT
jgi:hypothetical protein